MSKNTLSAMILVTVPALYLSTAHGENAQFVPPGTQPQRVNVDVGQGGCEGPTVDAHGDVYFTTTQMSPGGKTGSVQKWTWADGKVVKLRDVPGGAIGSALDAKGRLLVAEWDNQRITADDLHGHVSVIADSVDGRKMIAPNTLVVDRKGGVYFTEWPGFKVPAGRGGAAGAGGPGPGAPPANAAPSSSPPGGAAPQPEAADSEFAGIDYISPDGNKITQVAKIKGSHKVALSPDGKTLIASGSQFWKFKVNADGSLSDRQEFCSAQCANLRVDGMTFDENQDLFMAGDKIYVYNLKGERLGAIDLATGATNLRFAGKDRKTMFVTGFGAAYTVQMSVRGPASSR